MTNKNKKVLEPKELAMLEQMARIRLPLTTIAHIFGINVDTLHRILKRDDKARSSFDRGLETGRGEMYAHAYKRAMQSDRVLIWWLATQEGWGAAKPVGEYGGGPVPKPGQKSLPAPEPMNPERRKALIMQYNEFLKETEGEQGVRTGEPDGGKAGQQDVREGPLVQAKADTPEEAG